MDNFNKRRKLERTLENEEKNKDKINQELQPVSKVFRSINYFKNIGNMKAYEGELYDENVLQYSVKLSGLPENLVTLTRPHFQFYLPSAYNWDREIPSFYQAFTQGKLKDGDIEVDTYNITSWWIKTNDGYDFNFRLNINIRVAEGVSNFGFGSSAIPVFFDLTMYFANERYYNEIQSGKK